MPTKSRTKSQAKFDKRAIKKLQKTGLYTKKVDLRRAPTPYQSRLIARFKAVILGKSVAVKPAHPEKFAGIFQTKGKIVIIPRSKGQKITVDKNGELHGVHDVGGVHIVSKWVPFTEKLLENPDPSLQYSIPFIRGRDASGKAILEWRNFNANTLKRFINEYKSEKYKDIAKYVVARTLTFNEVATVGTAHPGSIEANQLSDLFGEHRPRLRFPKLKGRKKFRKANKTGR